MSEVRQLIDRLNERLNAADCIGQALDHAAGDAPPSWVFVYRGQVEANREATEALETHLLAKLRGDGGYAPHGGQAPACLDAGRGQPGTLPGPDSRPEKLSSLVHE
jgi:hypothetical protein